jgi:hypothetical protein
LRAGLLVSIAALLLAASFWDYGIALRPGSWRLGCLGFWMIAGLAATVCLSAAMHVLNRAGDQGASGAWRLTEGLGIRLISVMQVCSMGLLLGGAGLLFFGKPVPGGDRAVLTPGWSPPVSVPSLPDASPLPFRLRSPSQLFVRPSAPDVP